MNTRSKSITAGCALALVTVFGGCDAPRSPAGLDDASPNDTLNGGGKGRGTKDATAPDSSTTPDSGAVADAGGAALATTLTVELQPQVASTASRRINFAVPLPPGQLTSADRIQVRAGGAALPTARRALATWPGGSLRSVQLQFDLAVPAATTIAITIGEAASSTIALVPVEQTLATADGTTGPAVWAVLPATWLSTSRVAGPSRPSAQVAGTPQAAWDRICDYTAFGTNAFTPISADQGSWLYDRPTALYRGYQRTGSLTPLRSAYREAAMYRAGVVGTGTGSATRIGVPASSGDLKYHYTQGLAIHYLLTGDDRFREAAENVGIRAHDLWLSPGYAGGADFWTERHAGFGLLAYEWAAAVSDDKAAQFTGWAAEAVSAYLAEQATYPAGYTSTTERCFAHSAEAHGESYGYFGCSPWMSAILADALDTHADRLAGAGNAAGAQAVRSSLVKLGQFVASQGRDTTGRPLYWAGVGVTSDELDTFDEHWGESAYVVALAWYWSGKTSSALRQAADALVAGFDTKGEAGQLRSFNWQCRSGVMTPFYLQP